MQQLPGELLERVLQEDEEEAPGGEEDDNDSQQRDRQDSKEEEYHQGEQVLSEGTLTTHRNTQGPL